jgi:hypothetical protein
MRMSGVYHAALMEFKFQASEDDSHILESEFKSMQDYL